MGAVYLAIERSLERLVAIKVLSPEISAIAENTERFRREARIAARLAHPNIVPLYAFGEVDGLWYYVMGYVRGGSVAERLSFEGRLPCEVVQRVLSELADALDCAHGQGIIHRDIKPGNVLLEADSGRAMLADFGIARTVDAGERLTASGLVIGTPTYMSPEQAIGAREIDGRSDIYSLGVLAYAMLTGEEPVAGKLLVKTAISRAPREPQRLRELVPDIPPNLVAVIERCLAGDPDARWPDGRSLKRALGHSEATETATPAELRDLPGFGTLAALWAVVWGGLAVADYGSPAEAALCVLLAMIVPLGLVLDVWSAKPRGLRAREIIRVAFWPPMWWGLWWPHSLRRRGDLWDRLPRIARVARLALTGLVIGAPVLLLLAHVTLPSPIAGALAATPWWFAATASVLVLIPLAVLGAVLWWGRAHGLSVLEMVRLVHGPTIISAFWTAPPIAGLLAAPAAQRGQPSPPETPRELLRAIGDLTHSLSGAARVVGDAATTVARRLVERIDRLDAEVAALGRESDPDEIARLEVRLAAMSDAASEVDEQRQMRQVLLRQLELVRRMHAQIELGTGRRAHLVGLLQRMWARLAERVAYTGRAAVTIQQLEDRVRAVCAEVDEQVDDDVASQGARVTGSDAEPAAQRHT